MLRISLCPKHYYFEKDCPTCIVLVAERDERAKKDPAFDYLTNAKLSL